MRFVLSHPELAAGVVAAFVQCVRDRVDRNGNFGLISTA
jgi:hypothetical protein